MMNELMSNPYAWLILSFCTIFSVVFAIYTWIVGKRTKEISIDYYSNDIIKQGKQPIPKLSIEFDGQKIEDLTATTFYIWNSGNDVINNTDIVGETLKIECKSDKILDTQIIKQSDNSNQFEILKVTPTNIEFVFDYIDSGEGITLQILHTGSGSDLNFYCKIKGGKIIRDCPKIKKSKGISAFLKGCIDELLPMIFFVMGSFGSVIVAKLIGFSNEKNSVIIFIISIVITILILIIYLKTKKKIRQALHREIPTFLKKV